MRAGFSLFLLVGSALAFPQPLSASPRPGETVRVSPARIRLRFNEPLAFRGCVFKVYHLAATLKQLEDLVALQALAQQVSRRVLETDDPAHERVDTGLLAPVEGSYTVNIGLKPLMPGAYVVMWHATTTHQDGTEGLYVFVYLP